MSQPYPYYNTKIGSEQTQGQITKMLYDFGCEATRWTTDREGGNVVLEFLWRIETEGSRKAFAFRVQPPMLLKSVGRGDARRMMPNPGATMRLLWWYLKSKLEAVKYGLVKLEEEFLQDIVVPLPGGKDATMGEVLVPQIQSGKVLGIREWVKALPTGEESE